MNQIKPDVELIMLESRIIPDMSSFSDILHFRILVQSQLVEPIRIRMLNEYSGIVHEKTDVVNGDVLAFTHRLDEYAKCGPLVQAYCNVHLKAALRVEQKNYSSERADAGFMHWSQPTRGLTDIIKPKEQLAEEQQLITLLKRRKEFKFLSDIYGSTAESIVEPAKVPYPFAATEGTKAADHKKDALKYMNHCGGGTQAAKPTELNKENILDAIVACAAELDAMKIPTEGRIGIPFHNVSHAQSFECPDCEKIVITSVEVKSFAYSQHVQCYHCGNDFMARVQPTIGLDGSGVPTDPESLNRPASGLSFVMANARQCGKSDLQNYFYNLWLKTGRSEPQPNDEMMEADEHGAEEDRRGIDRDSLWEEVTDMLNQFDLFNVNTPGHCSHLDKQKWLEVVRLSREYANAIYALFAPAHTPAALVRNMPELNNFARPSMNGRVMLPLLPEGE